MMEPPTTELTYPTTTATKWRPATVRFALSIVQIRAWIGTTPPHSFPPKGQASKTGT